jgi:phosphopantothenoylcysteine decarboxylase/phosphopantothenate--cysteine ligase
MRLLGKKIILGVTGSIAAYKAAVLLRHFIKEGAEVQVVITENGKQFITPLTLSTLSGKPVLSAFFDSGSGNWNSHVNLGLWADLMIVAPATATTISKMALGNADNLLITTYLSARCPVMVAPAMDLDMFQHPSTEKNISILKNYGALILEPATGFLASGLEGKGRMKEPEEILETVVEYFISKKRLTGKSFLVTAGPTFEKIDPVRFVGNYSSGKMGFAIAEKLAGEGSEVTLVSGPVLLSTDHKNIKLIRVESAAEMYDECIKRFENCNGAVMCAAVSDFTPVEILSQKSKRGKANWSIELKPTTDIAASLGKIKRPDQLLVGFALETNNEIENAAHKLNSKNLDFIVLNSLNDPGAGFGTDTNKVTFIDKYNNQQVFELKNKGEVAADVVEKIISMTE